MFHVNLRSVELGGMCGARGDSPSPRVYLRSLLAYESGLGVPGVHQSVVRDLDRMQLPRLVGALEGSWPRSVASREW
ncbi:hypothetical protein RHCRD62_70128 [Rhodococcus sp. RD6.2]|nr:hypothetical protein RHCRD62_70128 [Rhodococcus sp. RD6.2]